MIRTVIDGIRIRSMPFVSPDIGVISVMNTTIVMQWKWDAFGIAKEASGKQREERKTRTAVVLII